MVNIAITYCDQYCELSHTYIYFAGSVLVGRVMKSSFCPMHVAIKKVLIFFLPVRLENA